MAQPKLCFHKHKALFYVLISGRRYYLGRDRAAAAAERLRLLADLLPGSPAPTPRPRPGITINEVLAAFAAHAETYYRHPDGTPTSEITNLRRAVVQLRRLYGDTPAAEFGPLALAAVREAMIADGRCRTRINRDCIRIKTIFKWAVSRELAPPAVHAALATLAGLRAGRSAARESPRVLPVDDAAVDATLAGASPTLTAMVRLQQLTGMRPGEVCQMRPGDVDRTGPVWVYRPARHKTQHRGAERVIHLGPRAQAVLLPFLDRPADCCCFLPSESRAWYRQRNQARTVRTTRRWPCEVRQQARRRRPKRLSGYTVASYGAAIRRMCQAAGVESWAPHRLRHAAATRLRAEVGPDLTRAILGQRSLQATSIYAELDHAGAAKAMGKLG